MKDQPQALAQGSGELYKEYVEYESEEDKNGATDENCLACQILKLKQQQ